MSNKDYVRAPYTSLFTRTIGIDCLYRLEGVDTLLVQAFDKFWIILGTTNSVLLLARRRLLKLLQRLRKRNARTARLYAAGIGVTIGRRNLIGAEFNNPNNPYLLGDDDDKATQLARRNSEPQVLIQYQPNRRIAALEDKKFC